MIPKKGPNRATQSPKTPTEMSTRPTTVSANRSGSPSEASAGSESSRSDASTAIPKRIGPRQLSRKSGKGPNMARQLSA